jgi:hypothetical protein
MINHKFALLVATAVTAFLMTGCASAPYYVEQEVVFVPVPYPAPNPVPHPTPWPDPAPVADTSPVAGNDHISRNEPLTRQPAETVVKTKTREREPVTKVGTTRTRVVAEKSSKTNRAVEKPR